jgi:hypothetical protein
VTFDREFSRRRRQNPIGHHIWLDCPEPTAAGVLQTHLAEVLDLLRREHVVIRVTEHSVNAWSKSG